MMFPLKKSLKMKKKLDPARLASAQRAARGRIFFFLFRNIGGSGLLGARTPERRTMYADSLAMNAPSRGAVARMKAAVVTGPRRSILETVDLPAPAAGQVRVRLAGCGVCASNVEPWQGPAWMSFPTEPGGLGHEGWGIVDAVGEGVIGLEPGDPVATLFQRSYAQFDIGEATQVVKLPAALHNVPFPGEPLACAVNILRRSDVDTGHTVAVLGVGFLGAILTRLAVEAGAQVIAVARRPYALDVARRMGATEVVPFGDRGETAEAVMRMTGGRGCDRVIEAAGVQPALDLATEIVAEHGRLVIAGYHQDGPRTVDMQKWNWKGLDVVNAHERRPETYVDGLKQAIALVERGVIPLDELLTHSYPLARLDEALAATRDRPDGFLKAWVSCA